MNEDQFKKLIEQALKENSVQVKNNTEKENSNLVYSLKEVFQNELKEQKEHIMEIKADVKEVKGKVEFQNGRVRKLEDWSNDTKTILENTLGDYKINKGRVWLAFTLLTILGGTIIGLSIIAIDSKIEKGVEQALSKYEIEYQPYEER